MEVFYDNPDCKNEGEDLPCSSRYQTLVAQIILVCGICNNTLMVAKKDEFSWYLSMSLMR